MTLTTRSDSIAYSSASVVTSWQLEDTIREMTDLLPSTEELPKPMASSSVKVSSSAHWTMCASNGLRHDGQRRRWKRGGVGRWGGSRGVHENRTSDFCFLHIACASRTGNIAGVW